MRIILTEELLDHLGESYQNSVSKKIGISFEKFVEIYTDTRLNQ